MAQTSEDKDTLANPFQVVQKYINNNNYITPLIELKQQEEKYLASPRWQSVYLEMMILLQGYVGNYKEAYRYQDIFHESSPAFKHIKEMYKADIIDIQTSAIADYERIDALDAIETAAENEQIIIINEEHRTPFHRATTLELLSILYEKGFRYFAAETLNSGNSPDASQDTDLNKRGYVLQQSGFYTADPVYADAIRTALKLGYTVVPYESSSACESPEDNPEYCDDQRERGQAQNIYDRILKNDPQAKILIHVGRSHANKSKVSDEFSFMAYYLWQLSNINPFTIDQLRFSEFKNTAYEQPLYRLLTKDNILQSPSVFQSSTGDFYTMSNGFNMMIFHPRMKYVNGRAEFMKLRGTRKASKINLEKLKLKPKNKKQTFTEQEPILVQAFYTGENIKAVPVDQVILYPDEEISVLMLPRGKFLIRAMDGSGKIIGEYITNL